LREPPPADALAEAAAEDEAGAAVAVAGAPLAPSLAAAAAAAGAEAEPGKAAAGSAAPLLLEPAVALELLGKNVRTPSAPRARVTTAANTPAPTTGAQAPSIRRRSSALGRPLRADAPTPSRVAGVLTDLGVSSALDVGVSIAPLLLERGAGRPVGVPKTSLADWPSRGGPAGVVGCGRLSASSEPASFGKAGPRAEAGP